MSAAVKQGGRSKASLRTWIRMISCTILVESRLRTKLRDEFDVTLPQFDILAELDRAEAPQTMSELSRQLLVSNANVTGVVDRLERAGFVKRTASSTDRRVHYIALTPTGKSAFAKMARRHEEWVQEMLGELTEDELGSLGELLSKAKRSAAAGPLGEIQE
ncbi:MAG: MarR family transcriptional regulator [Armatimonadetes bacterium]|nr:MarR family transcriptional regulator [Armatimonadota bacterium]